MSKNNWFNNLPPKPSRPIVVGRDAINQRIGQLQRELNQQPPMILPPPPGMSPMRLPPPNLFPQFLEFMRLLDQDIWGDKNKKR